MLLDELFKRKKNNQPSHTNYPIFCHGFSLLLKLASFGMMMQGYRNKEERLFKGKMILGRTNGAEFSCPSEAAAALSKNYAFDEDEA